MNELVTKEMLFVMNEDGEMVLSEQAIDSIREMEVEKKKIDKLHKKYKEVILKGMEEYGIKKVETEDLLVTYLAPSEKMSLDTDKLWKEHKDVAFECQKVSPVKSSIRITVR